MDLKPELQIKTAIKAMTDVVLPAVDPDNKLAQEQAQLVIGMLGLAVSQLPLMFRYERDELMRFLDLARQIQPQTREGSAVAAALAISLQRGADVLERARAEPDELTQANAALRDAIGALVTEMGTQLDANAFKRVATAVTAHADGQLLRERALVRAQGWEPDPESIPAIDSLLAPLRPGCVPVRACTTLSNPIGKTP